MKQDASAAINEFSEAAAMDSRETIERFVNRKQLIDRGLRRQLNVGKRMRYGPSPRVWDAMPRLVLRRPYQSAGAIQPFSPTKNERMLDSVPYGRWRQPDKISVLGLRVQEQNNRCVVKDQKKSKEQRIEENDLCRRVAALEDQLARSRQAESRYRELHNCLPILVAAVGVDGYYKDVNAAFERILGWSEQESLSRPFMEFIHPEDRTAAVTTFGRLKAGESVNNFQARSTCKDGSHRWVNWTMIPLLDGDIVFAIGQDVTEQKLAEDELRHSEARWRSLIENVAAQVGAVDRAGTILSLNRPAPGLTLERVIGTSVFEYLQPEHCVQARQCIEQVFRTGETVVNESIATGPHGTRSWYETRLGPVKVDEQVVAVALISTDITERKQAEAALRESEERFRRIFDEGALGIVLATLDGHIQRVNRRFCDLLGYSEEEIIELGIERLSPPEDFRIDAQSVTRLLGGEIPRYTIEKRFCRKDGQVIWGRLTVSLLHDAEGIPTHAIGMTEDITEHKRAEKEVQEANEQLEHRVLERTAELAKANALLQAEVEQRRQAEEALRDSEKRLNFALMASQTGAWDLDLLDHTAHRSLQHDHIFGYESLLPAWTYEMFLEHVLPEDREGVDRQFRQAVDTQGDWSFECRIRRHDGETRWIWAAGRHRSDENSIPRRMAGIVQDITDRKKAEEAIRVSEAKYRALVESSPDAVAMVDLQGRVVFASERAVELHGGVHPDDLIGSQATDHVVESGRDKFRASMARLIDDGVHRNVEHVLLRRDGTTFDAEISSAVISDAAGKPEAFMAVYRDISKRKRAEELMRQTRDELATIYDGIIEGLLITDIETKRFVRMNAAFCRMLGYSEEELLTKAIKDIHPAEEVLNDEQRFHAAAEGRVSINEDRPVLRKDGSIFYADITGHRIFYDQRPCLLALFRDVTERRQAEEKLKAEQKSLRRMLIAGDHERHLITYELHDGVAQQLLGAKMLFESCQRGRKSKPAKGFLEGTVALIRATSELRRVMNWLRTPVLDKFGVAAAVEDVAAQLRLTPGAPEIECRHDCQFQRLEPTLENTLFRIAQEAMTNACRHSKSEKIRVQLMQKGDEVMLEVRDWGIGFDPGVISENRFGLEGIRERARILGGRLSIKSVLGKGTTVHVTFKVVEAREETEGE